MPETNLTDSPVLPFRPLLSGYDWTPHCSSDVERFRGPVLRESLLTISSSQSISVDSFYSTPKILPPFWHYLSFNPYVRKSVRSDPSSVILFVLRFREVTVWVASTHSRPSTGSVETLRPSLTVTVTGSSFPPSFFMQNSFSTKRVLVYLRYHTRPYVSSLNNYQPSSSIFGPIWSVFSSPSVPSFTCVRFLYWDTLKYNETDYNPSLYHLTFYVVGPWESSMISLFKLCSETFILIVLHNSEDL